MTNSELFPVIGKPRLKDIVPKKSGPMSPVWVDGFGPSDFF